jgi:uncharacterized protein (DUF4415 family)
MGQSKNFKGNNPIEKLTTPAPAEESKRVAVKPSAPKKEPEIRKTTPVKRRVGRPVVIEDPRKNINIAVKVELLDKYDEVKKALGGNLTAYIGKLIEKDMNENYENYKTIARLQEEMGL